MMAGKHVWLYMVPCRRVVRCLTAGCQTEYWWREAAKAAHTLLVLQHLQHVHANMYVYSNTVNATVSCSSCLGVCGDHNKSDMNSAQVLLCGAADMYKAWLTPNTCKLCAEYSLSAEAKCSVLQHLIQLPLLV